MDFDQHGKSLRAVIIETPYECLTCIDRDDIFIKLECNQFGGSFKSRGIMRFMSKVDKPTGLVTFTTGNHGISVSAIAEKRSIPSLIVTSSEITNYKRSIIEANGGTIHTIDFQDLDKATRMARQHANALGYTFVPLYDDQNLLDGYSEIGAEIYKDFQRDIIAFFPVGSGSILYANAKTLKRINPKNAIVGVEPAIYQRLGQTSFRNRQSLSIADCLAIDAIPKSNLKLLDYTDDIIPINESDIQLSMKFIFENYGLMTEPGGAITLAAALKTIKNSTPKIAVITGKNISNERFITILK